MDQLSPLDWEPPFQRISMGAPLPVACPPRSAAHSRCTLGDRVRTDGVEGRKMLDLLGWRLSSVRPKTDSLPHLPIPGA